MVVDVVVEILTVILDELFLPVVVLPSKDTSRCEMMTNHNVNNHIKEELFLLHPHMNMIRITTKVDVREMDANDIFSIVLVAMPETIVKNEEIYYEGKW